MFAMSEDLCEPKGFREELVRGQILLGWLPGKKQVPAQGARGAN